VWEDRAAAKPAAKSAASDTPRPWKKPTKPAAKFADDRPARPWKKK